ncbi:MAG: hypothetical protein IAI49_16950 [Candidatus Eremiobacteraeota bacterium]|nr:hypothetical protein [Candidatus Eremiobacteraeota bacterium]
MDVTRNGRLFSALLALAVAAGTSSGAAPAIAASLTVPISVSIPVYLTQPLTTQTAHVGDPFTFATSEDTKLGTLVVPRGTPGHGRLAVVRAAAGKANGQLSLQADSLDLITGDTIWVNIDPSKPPKGRLADKHTKPLFLPLPIGLGGGYVTSTTGNMILDKGTTFTVVTIAPRASPAPLLTASPTPLPSGTPVAPLASPAAKPATPAPAPAPTAH